MDGLRWLLLIFGLLVVAGVYWYSRREAERGSREKRAPRHEPSLSPGAGAGAGAQAASDEPSLPAAGEEEGDDERQGGAAAAPEKIVTEKIVTLRLVAGGRGYLSGEELALSLRGIGMRHGQFGIFHRYEGNDEQRIIFSAASLVEPGSFDLGRLKEQKFPGISLFMVLPGPVDGAEAFDLMMASARALARALDAELLDESGSTMSIQRERYLREEIIRYQHGIKVA